MEPGPFSSHHGGDLPTPTAISVGTGKPSFPSEHICPNCGFVSVVSSLHSNGGEQIHTKTPRICSPLLSKADPVEGEQIYTDTPQICSPLLPEAYSNDFFSQPVEEDEVGEWVPDTEEPFDLGLDFGRTWTAYATTRPASPSPVPVVGCDGGAAKGEADEDGEWVPDTEDPFDLGIDYGWKMNTRNG